MGQKNKNYHIFIASQYENQEAIKTSKLTEQTTKKEWRATFFFQPYHAKLTLVYLHLL